MSYNLSLAWQCPDSTDKSFQLTWGHLQITQHSLNCSSANRVIQVVAKFQIYNLSSTKQRQISRHTLLSPQVIPNRSEQIHSQQALYNALSCLQGIVHVQNVLCWWSSVQTTQTVRPKWTYRLFQIEKSSELIHSQRLLYAALSAR